MSDIAKTFRTIPATVRQGIGRPGEHVLISALVALPFSATLGILLAQFGLHGAVAIVIAALAQVGATFWVAGYRDLDD